MSLNFKGDRSGLFHDYTANEHAIVEVFTDANWASCKDDRRNIGACAVFYGGCLLHSSSRTQKIVSLSSAESEMYAAASGACDSVLIVGILKWMFDAFFHIHLYLDSAAARGIINRRRRGVGKVRHLSCRSLWLQERMADGSLVVSPVSGTTNPADIGTKRLNVNRMKALMFLLGMFDSVNSCPVGETEAHSIIHQQEIRKAMQSVRRLVKCEDSHLQILVRMSAWGLARGQGSADQSTSFAVSSWWMTATCTVFAFVLGGIFIWIMNFKKVEPNKNDAATQAGEGDGDVDDDDDDDDSIPEESDQERNRRYLNSEMTEVSDPDLSMNLHHHTDEDEDSEENVEGAELDGAQLRILQALDSDDDRISNPAIAMWLLARLDRRIAEADEKTRAAYFPLADRMSNAIRNISQGDTPGDPADLRRTLRQFCILSPRVLSPTNSLTAGQIGEEIVQNYNIEFNGHEDEPEENENTNQPEAGAEPVPEGEEGIRIPAHLYFEDNNPVYGPLTHIDSQIQEIQDRRAENLAILTERYDNAYIHGDQEEMWAIELKWIG